MDKQEAKTLFTAQEMERMIRALAEEVLGAHPGEEMPALVGIRTGGIHLANRLREVMGQMGAQQPDLGVMDITLYRDDWTRLHHRPKVGKTELGFPIDDRNVLLVDDVLFTGRTIRAALDLLVDFGRPRRIGLAVLVDRGHRELPIQPDFVGAKVNTTYQQAVDVLFTEQGHAQDEVVLR